MEGMYIVPIAESTMNEQHEGVVKKINSQINIFNRENLCTKLYCYEDSTFYKVTRLFPFNLFISNRKYQSCFDNKGFFYIRKMSFDYPFIKLLKNIKKRNTKCKIVLEIPTFPYDNETNKITYLPLKLKDLYYRKELYKYVDRIVTFSDDEEIFSIPTIKISNGVDMDKIKVKKVIDTKNEINVIAVAMLSFWHGYDRFIEGLGIYYKNGGKRNITFHIVGDGNSLPLYKELVNKYNISHKVIFHGKKSGKELDEIYDICDIGVDALGRHRSGVYYNSSLKGKEYAAKGLPIVSGVRTELDYAKSFGYYLRVPADDTPIYMEKVIKFYEETYSDDIDKAVVINEIRAFAQLNFNMDVCMKPVVDYIKNQG